MSTVLPGENSPLKGYEDDFVSELSTRDYNPPDLCKEFFQMGIITSEMCDNFNSLDHRRLDPKIWIRYLLRLVCRKVKTDATAWIKLLTFLNFKGNMSTSILEKLQKQTLVGMNKDPNEVSYVVSSETASGNARGKEDIILSHADVGLLTELLVPISHIWEQISIALGFQQHDRENFRKYDNKISLSKCIDCWVSREFRPTLRKLIMALKSELVGAGRVAMNVEKTFNKGLEQNYNAESLDLITTIPTLSTGDISLSFSILKTSYHTEVDDGKSTLLQVHASPRENLSYQWKKDNQVLVNGSSYSGVHDDLLVVKYASQGTEGEYTCCVRRQGKELCSNKITLTVIFHPSKKRLLNLYLAKTEIPKDSWPPTVSKQFINLALLKFKGDATYFSVCGNADVIIAEKEKVEYSEVFSKYESGELILIEGRPGSGKTTLVNKIIKDWAKGKVLTEAMYVIFVPLRVLNFEGRDETLSDILKLLYTNEHELKTVRDFIERNDGSRICFVVDGLDEYQHKKNSVIYNLLYKKYLPLAMVIVSSRPSTTTVLKTHMVTKHLEVFGFSKEQVLEYIENFQFDSVNTALCAETLKTYLKSNTNIYNLCYLPVHAAMICFLFKYDQGFTSCTQTKIYEQFTQLIISRHLLSHDAKIQLLSLRDLSGTLKKYFEDLCHLAYKMSTKSKQVISQHELDFQLTKSDSCHGDEFCLGLITCFSTAHLTCFHQNYSFLHLTFQEFLAAYYIASLDSSKQMEIIEQYSGQKHMINIWTFYCGLTDFQYELKKFQKILECNKNCSMEYLMQCGYESQQSQVCDEVVKHLHGQLRSYRSTPSNLLCTGYVISTTSQPVTAIKLSYENKITILLELMSQVHLCYLTTLILNSTIYATETFMLIRILKSAPNLENLTLQLKNISPDKTTMLTEQLKQLSKLQALSLSFITMDSCSISMLVGGLSIQFKELSLSFEDIDTKGVLALGRAFQYANTNLQELELKNCNISLDGMTGLINSLQYLTGLVELILRHNQIQLDGFDTVWNSLRHLDSLTKLDLSGNNFWDDNVSNLASSLPHFTRLSLLALSHIKFRNSWCCLVEKLRHMTTLASLDLSHDNIALNEIAGLASVLKYLTRLWSLNLSHNNIGPDGMIALSTGLKCLTELHDLNVSHNNIDLESAKAIITSLKKTSSSTMCCNHR